MKKIVISMIALLVLTAMLTACGVQSPATSSPEVEEVDNPLPSISLDPDDGDPEYFYPGFRAETSEYYLDFDATIDLCTDILTATLHDIDFSENGFLLHFSRDKLIWAGDVPEVFTVIIYYSKLPGPMNHEYGYSKEDCPYEEGKSYVLMLYTYESVYQEGYYTPLVNMYIPLDPLDGEKILTEGVSCYHNDVPRDKERNPLYFSTLQELEKYIQARENTSIPPLKQGVPYVRSNKPEDIIRDTDYIARVRVGDIIGEPGTTRSLHKIEILETYKGDLPEVIMSMLFSGTVQIGEEYLMCLNADSVETSGYYPLASKKNSVIPMEDTERVAQYLDLLEQYNKE